VLDPFSGADGFTNHLHHIYRQEYNLRFNQRSLNMNIINGLHFNNLRGDIYGGLTAAVVALPLAMAMGVSSGVGAIAGLYGAIFVGFFAAFFGGTPSQVSGPTGPMTVVMAAIFLQYTGMFPEHPEQGVALAFSVVVFGGLIQILMGFLRLGRYIELVPHPVVSGFMSGIGVIIILLQIAPFLGEASISKPISAAMAIPDLFMHMQMQPFLLGLLALVVVYGVPAFLPRLDRLLPSPLLALILGTLVYILFFSTSDTPIIGDIPTGLPQFRFPQIDLSLGLTMLGSSLTLAALGAIDSLLTSLVADNQTRTQHKSDRELIGQGIGNTIAGLFGGLPGAGATMRTVVNVKAGGQTPISGMLHAIILLVVVVGAGSLASNIPKAVLAGILIKVGTDIIDWDYLKRLPVAPKAGIVIMLTVLIITVTIDLMLAVAIGMIMASFLFMDRMTKLQIKSMATITQADPKYKFSPTEEEILDRSNGRIVIFSLSGPMSFSSAKAMVRQHAKIHNYKVLLLDMSDVTVIDYTTSRAINDIIIDTKQSGHHILLIPAIESVHEVLKDQDILNHFKAEKIFELREQALLHAEELLYRR